MPPVASEAKIASKHRSPCHEGGGLRSWRRLVVRL